MAVDVWDVAVEVWEASVEDVWDVAVDVCDVAVEGTDEECEVAVEVWDVVDAMDVVVTRDVVDEWVLEELDGRQGEKHASSYTR